MACAATESSSTMIACICAPAAVTIAVSYWVSTWASCATVPWMPLVEPGPQLLQLPIRVVVFDLVGLPGLLDLRDLGLETGHRLFRAVPLEHDALDPLLHLVDLVVERNDLLLDAEDLRVALRGQLVDFMEVFVRRLDLLVEFAHAGVDLFAFSGQGVRFLLDLRLLPARLTGLDAELLQDFLRGLGSVRRPRAFDPEAVQLLLELLRLFAASLRHLLFELVQARDGRVEERPEFGLLAFQFRLVGLVFRDLFLRADDLPFD